MWAKAGFFIMKHWRAIALIIMVTGASYSLWHLYEDNKTLEGERQVAEERLERCKSVREDLSSRLDKVVANLQQVEGARQQLEDLVDASEDEIDIIQRERDRLLWEIQNREVPEACEEKFDWMVERFKAIERQFYDGEDEQ